MVGIRLLLAVLIVLPLCVGQMPNLISMLPQLKTRAPFPVAMPSPAPDPAMITAQREQAFSEVRYILQNYNVMLIRLGDIMSELSGRVNYFLCPLVLGTSYATQPTEEEVLDCLPLDTCHVMVTFLDELCKRAPKLCYPIVRLVRLCPILRLPGPVRSRPLPPTGAAPMNMQMPLPPNMPMPMPMPMSPPYQTPYQQPPQFPVSRPMPLPFQFPSQSPVMMG